MLSQCDGQWLALTESDRVTRFVPETLATLVEWRWADKLYEAIRRDSTQAAVPPLMQTRDELYERIGYHAFEQALDRLAR